LPGIDDAHVEAGPDGMKQKRRVHGLPHRVVATEREGNVADPAADARAGKVRFDPSHCLDEVDGVIAMLLQAGCNR